MFRQTIAGGSWGQAEMKTDKNSLSTRRCLALLIFHK